MSQLEAETPTTLAVSELLKIGCEVFLEGDAGGDRMVPLDNPAATITEAQVGAQGSSFLNISLDVRPASNGLASGADRRQAEMPEVIEVVTSPPLLAILPEPQVVEEERRQISLPDVVEVRTGQDAGAGDAPVPDDPTQPMSVEKLEEIFADQEDEPIAAARAMASTMPLEESAVGGSEQPAAAQSDSAAAPQSAPPKIVAIVAERPARQPRSTAASDGRKEYIRKSDWLRAQFLPEVQALDFSGLFVGNLGMGVREQQARRNVVLADPARITDVLLRGNSFRRSGDHAKALICYQELVDMDPGNADFRFLLGKTLLDLGQHNPGIDALNRAKELGHEGARKELETAKPVVPRQRSPLGFLRFWKQ
jgi:hypothetical protein